MNSLTSHDYMLHIQQLRESNTALQFMAIVRSVNNDFFETFDDSQVEALLLLLPSFESHNSARAARLYTEMILDAVDQTSFAGLQLSSSRVRKLELLDLELYYHAIPFRQAQYFMHGAALTDVSAYDTEAALTTPDVKCIAQHHEKLRILDKAWLAQHLDLASAHTQAFLRGPQMHAHSITRYVFERLEACVDALLAAHAASIFDDTSFLKPEEVQKQLRARYSKRHLGYSQEFDYAVMSGHFEVADKLLELGHPADIDFSEILQTIVADGSYHILDYVMSHNLHLASAVLESAAQHHDNAFDHSVTQLKKYAAHQLPAVMTQVILDSIHTHSEKFIQRCMQEPFDFTAEEHNMLVLASNAGMEKVFMNLLKAGADINAQQSEAFINSHWWLDDSKLLKLITEHGANAAAQGGRLLTTLATAGNLALSKQLIELGHIDPKLCALTLLQNSVSANDVPLTHYYLQLNLNSYQDVNSCITAALQTDSLQALQMLFSYGASLDAVFVDVTDSQTKKRKVCAMLQQHNILSEAQQSLNTVLAQLTTTIADYRVLYAAAEHSDMQQLLLSWPQTLSTLEDVYALATQQTEHQKSKQAVL